MSQGERKKPGLDYNEKREVEEDARNAGRRSLYRASRATWKSEYDSKCYRKALVGVRQNKMNGFMFLKCKILNVASAWRKNHRVESTEAGKAGRGPSGVLWLGDDTGLDRSGRRRW